MSDNTRKSPRRKSKRRSSFAASRINILQQGTSGEELYQEIDNSKPPDERLIMLTKVCLEYTLKKMEDQMTGCRDFSAYKREVEEAVLRKIADMEVKGVFKEASEKESMLPNPINSELDSAIEEMKAKISRLQEETNKWDQLVTETENKISECDQLSKQPHLTELDISDTLKAQSGKYLCNRLDYNSLLADLNQSCQKICLLVGMSLLRIRSQLSGDMFSGSCQKTCLLVHDHTRVVNRLDTAFKHISSNINKQVLHMKESQQPLETPRRVMQSLLSFPTPK
ncbi:unnamed protein product [Mytilus coruscus]|uniref:Uncharacterized protein n=1 Tax=Mytilus coruscus TaxID=42192 RepID=A0A6J8DHW3_MYTCO|nr:unnamed protein product [Mytilus coruscus]